jgi:hypothetical protein
VWAYSSLKKNFNALKVIFKKMKKINYMAPEMEVIELQINATLLDISGTPVINTEQPTGEIEL